MRNYTDINGLSFYYLEDSYILGVAATPGLLCFEMEFVLTPEHVAYTPTHPGEQHCYRRGRMLIREVTELSWKDQGTAPSTDASGTTDYGNIDTLTVHGSQYTIIGDVGVITVTGGSIEVRLD